LQKISSGHNQLFAASRSALSSERGSPGVMQRFLLALWLCPVAAFDCSNLQDHYATLNVTAKATREQIRVAAREAQLRTHPDKERAGDAFHKVQLAAATLLKSSKKKAYDRLRAHCEKPWPVRWVELQARKWSRWSSNAVPIYIYIIYIGDPTAMWALITAAWASFAASCLQAWAWVVANPLAVGAVTAVIVAVGVAWYFF
jgi:hypothetical protein